MKRMFLEVILVMLVCLIVSNTPLNPSVPLSDEPEFPIKPTLSEVESRSGTPIILERLNEARRNGLDLVFARPTDPDGDWPDYTQHLLPQLYNTTHFVLHWTNGSDGGDFLDAPPLNDTNGDGCPDYINQTAEIFEQVWDFEINQRGFLIPPTDETRPNDTNGSNPDSRYDVFILNTLAHGYLGLCYAEGEANESSWYSYIVVENDFGPPTDWEMPALDQMRAVAAHEFFHAVQFAYDVFEQRWWMETTATYMEDETYPDVNHNYVFLPDFFLWPDRGLENTSGNHEYGNFIFAKFLSEKFSDGIIKEIWEKMAEFDMDGLAAINATLVSKNSTLTEEFSRFITANFFLEDYYVDGADYREAVAGTLFEGVWLEYEYNATQEANHTEINETNVNWDTWIDEWGTDYITLELDSSKPNNTYTLFFDGLDLNADYLVKLVTKKAGTISETALSLDEQKDGNITLPHDTFSNIILVIANIGNTVTADPGWQVIIENLAPPPPPIYDVAIIDVEPSAPVTFPEQTIDISVTVLNNGTVKNETFNVSVYWGEFCIGTQSIIDLAPHTEDSLTIPWTVPEGVLGEAKIWTNASVVENETNIVNNRLEGGNLTITVGVHDGAIIDVDSKTIVGKGYPVIINATVQNQGNYTEIFTLTYHINASEIETKNITLASGEQGFIIFTWDTIGCQEYHNYTISVYLYSLLDEIDITDNTGQNVTVLVTMIGDVDGDQKVDIKDIALVAIRFGSERGDSKYMPNYDLNGDGKIDIKDISTAAFRFGKVHS
jgi:hypothetical protein